MSNLIRTLGLTLPQTVAAAVPAKALTDADFPADAKGRKRADAQATADGQRRLDEAKAAEADKKKGPGYTPPKPDLVDKLVDAAAKDVAKRAEALRQAGIPRFSERYDRDTDLSRFAEDLKSGTEAADAHIKRIQALSEHAQKVGRFVGLSEVAASAAQIEKIAKGISAGLGKVGKELDRAKKIARWCGALQDFAVASQAMDPADIASVKAWIGTVKTLWNATAPFLQWVNDKAWLAALEGSEAAGALGATTAIVGAYVFIGIHALEAGVRVEGQYFERMNRLLQESEDDAAGRVRRPPEPALPPAPAEWKSREEQQQEAIRLELAELRKTLDAPRLEADKQRRAKAQAAREQAEADFEARAFPGVYLKARAQFVAKVLQEMRKTQGGRPAADWWDCFMPGDGEPPIPEDEIGLYVSPVAPTVSLEEARQEIDELLGRRPPPPWLVQLRESAWKKHLDAALAKTG